MEHVTTKAGSVNVFRQENDRALHKEIYNHGSFKRNTIPIYLCICLGESATAYALKDKHYLSFFPSSYRWCLWGLACSIFIGLQFCLPRIQRTRATNVLRAMFFRFNSNGFKTFFFIFSSALTSSFISDFSVQNSPWTSCSSASPLGSSDSISWRKILNTNPELQFQILNLRPYCSIQISLQLETN